MTRKPLLVLDPAKLTDQERVILHMQGFLIPGWPEWATENKRVFGRLGEVVHAQG